MTRGGSSQRRRARKGESAAEKLQQRQDLAVGGGDRIAVELPTGNPSDFRVIERSGAATGDLAAINVQSDFEMGIGMTDGGHEGANSDPDFQLFLNLTNEGVLVGLLSPCLAAGELPESSEQVGAGTLSQKKSAVFLDGGGHDVVMRQGLLRATLAITIAMPSTAVNSFIITGSFL